MTFFLWLFRSTPRGAADSFLRSCISLNTGDSSTARRMRYPTRISTTEDRNGMRQPQAMNASSDMVLVSSVMKAVASSMPIGTPICG